MQPPPPPPVRILPGARGADKVWWEEASTSGVAGPDDRGPTTSTDPPPCLVVFFGGDRIEDAAAHPDVHRLQAPGEVARLLRARFGRGATLLIIAANRHEAGFACYDHFLAKTTLSGEPLGYPARVPDGQDDGAVAAGLPALAQLASLLAAGGWPPVADAAAGPASPPPLPPTHLVAFSKGGSVLNQALAEAAALAEAVGGGTGPPAAPPSPPASPLLAHATTLAGSLASFTYVDVGLPGRGAYACPPGAASLADRPGGPPTITLYGTPRQWGPGKGPQAAERDRMVAGLAGAGVPVAVVECGGGGRRESLAMHFRCLEQALGAPPPGPPGEG